MSGAEELSSPSPSLQAFRRAGQDHLAPSTFEERGTLVPFTSPSLVNCRVRRDYRCRLEVMLEPFVGASCAYVFPWAALPEVAPLTAHDSLLHRLIAERRALDPDAIREVVLEVACSGLGGAEMAAAAETAMLDDQERLRSYELFLILQIAAESGGYDRAALVEAVKTEEGRTQIRGMIRQLATQGGLDPTDFQAQVTTLVHQTRAVGAAWVPVGGRLRQMRERLLEFADMLNDWGKANPDGWGEQATFIARVAGHTAVIATDTLRLIDTDLTTATKDIAHIAALTPALTRHAQRLSWLLDGWALLIAQWAPTADLDVAREAIASIQPSLPVMPQAELRETRHLQMEAEFARRATRWVKANTDWRTGMPDSEMIIRMEALHAGSLR